MSGSQSTGARANTRPTTSPCKLPLRAELPRSTQGRRVEACDNRKTYLKSVELTRDGHAVPVVDELATVALNLWADEHEYTKFEPNLLGL